MRILIASPVRATPSVLAEFLLALSILEKKHLSIDFCFIDDNVQPLSKRMLKAFLQKFPGSILPASLPTESHAKIPTKKTIERHRLQLQQFAQENNYDNLLLLDCNFLIHPQTIQHLSGKPSGQYALACVKGVNTNDDDFQAINTAAGLWFQPVDSKVFIQQEATRVNTYPLVCIATDYGQNRGWERWHRGFQNDKSKYDAVRVSVGVSLLSSHLYLQGPNPELQKYISPQLWNTINQRASKSHRKLIAMLSIAQSFSFCITSSEKSLSILTCQVQLNKKYHTQQFMNVTVSTTPSAQGPRIDKINVTKFVETPPSLATPKAIHRAVTSRHPLLIASLIIRNESEWFLQRMLHHLNEIVDGFVIIDDDSDDNSAALCRSVIHKNLTLVELKRSLFHQEHKLRRFQWELTQAQNPEWILCLDADEFFEERWKDLLPGILAQNQYKVVGFRKYDMWNETHYRDDQLWSAHKALWPHLVRNVPQINNNFQTTNQHCGRIPVGYDNFPIMKSILRIKHYGSASPAIRERKYQRYSFLDPGGKFGNMAQYRSLMDENPNLVLWE